MLKHITGYVKQYNGNDLLTQSFVSCIKEITDINGGKIVKMRFTQPQRDVMAVDILLSNGIGAKMWTIGKDPLVYFTKYGKANTQNDEITYFVANVLHKVVTETTVKGGVGPVEATETAKVIFFEQMDLTPYSLSNREVKIPKGIKYNLLGEKVLGTHTESIHSGMMLGFLKEVGAGTVKVAKPVHNYALKPILGSLEAPFTALGEASSTLIGAGGMIFSDDSTWGHLMKDSYAKLEVIGKEPFSAYYGKDMPKHKGVKPDKHWDYLKMAGLSVILMGAGVATMAADDVFRCSYGEIPVPKGALGKEKLVPGLQGPSNSDLARTLNRKEFDKLIKKFTKVFSKNNPPDFSKLPLGAIVTMLKTGKIAKYPNIEKFYVALVKLSAKTGLPLTKGNTLEKLMVAFAKIPAAEAEVISPMLTKTLNWMSRFSKIAGKERIKIALREHIFWNLRYFSRHNLEINIVFLKESMLLAKVRIFHPKLADLVNEARILIRY